TVVLLSLATAALVLPTVAQYTHTPAEAHIRTLSDIVAVVLLIIFALSLPAAIRRNTTATAAATSASTSTGSVDATDSVDAAQAVDAAPSHAEPVRWPLWLAVGLLVVASLAAAFVSDWFVEALTPAMDKLHISQA